MKLELELQQSYILFSSSIRSDETRKTYTLLLKKFIEYLEEEDILLGNDPRQIERRIIDFIVSLKEQGKQYCAIHNYASAITAFYKINDIILNVTKISKFMPEPKRARKDRAYTHEEIRKMLEIADERMRAVISLLASTGMRIGAVPLLKLRNLEKIGDGNNYLYKIVVYEGFREEYFTFCTPECAKALDSYLETRSRYGEKLTQDSFLIREQYDSRNQFSVRRAQRQIKSRTLSWKLVTLAERSGIRQKEQTVEGGPIAASIRKEVSIAHGFRKFFTTQLATIKINAEIREMLLGHKIGLMSAYYRPSQEDMLLEYQNAIDNLTINEENRLKRKVEKLEVEKSRIDRIEAQILSLQSMAKGNML
jgi:integrase